MLHVSVHIGINIVTNLGIYNPFNVEVMNINVHKLLISTFTNIVGSS